MTGPTVDASNLGARMAETHSAVVVFLGDRAYKLKKPVDLGFLDFRERSAREAVCHREVELNRRLAPDVYLGVADVFGPDGAVCDHLVVMRRMPDERRLTRLLETDEPMADHLRHIAHQVATLHGRSTRTPDIDTTAGIKATRRRWGANTDALLVLSPRLLDPHVVEQVERVHALAMRYLDGRGPLFERRVRDGRGVDGHGDLLADDIFCLADGPRILDCIEFDDELRWGDGLSDAAFLAMDLERLGHPHLAALFLRDYAELTADSWPTSLAHHHVAYRAQVRAKVAAIRTADGHRQAAAEAAVLLDLARSHLEAARVRLVLVGGLPGTGKTTLAEDLARELGGTVLRSDVLRKELGGITRAAAEAEDFCTGLYAPQVTRSTYTRLLDEAEIALGMGQTVVLDATWTDREERRRARAVAHRTSADLVELRCELPAAIAAERLRARAHVGQDASDATPEIAALMAISEAPWPEAVSVSTLDRATAHREALDAIRR